MSPLNWAEGSCNQDLLLSVTLHNSEHIDLLVLVSHGCINMP